MLVTENPDSNPPCRVALLLIDVINDLDFEGADALLQQGLPMAQRIAALKCGASRVQMPTIYVNDNFGSGGPIFGKRSNIAAAIVLVVGKFPGCCIYQTRIISCFTARGVSGRR
jgi:nicotinamidase-related amidase